MSQITDAGPELWTLRRARAAVAQLLASISEDAAVFRIHALRKIGSEVTILYNYDKEGGQ